MWQAPLDDPYIRQVYVNGQRATLARLTGTFTAIEWAKGPLHDDDGLVLQQDAVFDSLLDARHLVFHWVMEWKDMVMLVDRIEKRADGSYVAWMLQPDWNAVFTMRMPDQFTYPQPGRSFFIENAQVLVNEPGEFYADIEKRMLYYMPRPGEDMATAQVIVSAREQLLRIQGYRIGEEVHDLAFEGLTFAYAGWNFSSLRSRFGWQAESFLVSSAYNAEAHPSTAVWVNGAQRIRFIRNRWQHLGGTALELPNNVTHMTVDGNLMHDLGDASILAGREMQMYMDETEEAVCSDVRITNNLIQETGRENLAGPAMMVYFGRNFTIAHNELRHYPYTGLSLGWGWDSYPDSTSLEDNVVTANRFDQGMLIARDGGAIYTLANQHGTIISENYISNQWDWTGGIYLDAGSSFITVDSNVIENTVFWLNHNTPAVHDNIISNNFSNTSNWNNNGVELSLLENNTIVTGNVWPEAAQKIMTSAGLETAYQDLRSLVSQVNDRPFPMAQDGKVYLADYTPWYVFPAQFYDYRVGAFPFDSDIFKRDELLSYRGVAYPHGIFTYPQSGLNYYLGRNFISFDTEFFVVGPTQCRGSDGAFLSIELDNEIVYTGPKLRNGSDPIHIHINVTGAEFLSIGTFPGDNSRCDYAVLGDPYVSK